MEGKGGSAKDGPKAELFTFFWASAGIGEFLKDEFNLFIK